MAALAGLSVGKDTIAPQARRFKELLLKTPPNFTKFFPGKTLKQIAAMEHGRESMAVRTINNNYIQRLSSLFGWAIDNGYAAVNPFTGLKLKNRRNPKDTFI